MKRNENRTLVLCDFDGTVSVKDIGFNLLTHFSGGRWEDLDRDFVAGRIGSLEAYRRMVGELRGSEGEYRSVARTLGEIAPGFAEFVRSCRDAGVTVKIVSDGFGLYIRSFLEELGLEEVESFANELCFLPGRKLAAEFPFASAECPDCGCCKRDLLRKFRDEFETIIYIGDGISDRCAAPEADLVFAKRSLYRYCLERGVSVFSFRDFTDVLRLFRFRLEGVVCDLDGTLIDSFRPIYESYRHTLVTLGYDPAAMEEKRSVVGVTLEESLKDFVGEEQLSRAIKIFREHYRESFRTGTHLLPGTREALDALADLGIPLAVATNKYGPFAREILDFLGVGRHFREIVGAGDGFPPKPSPEMLLAIARHLGVEPGGLAYLGDSPLDVMLGRAAGYETLAVPTGYYSPEELGKEKPSAVLGRIEDLVTVARALRDGIGG